MSWWKNGSGGIPQTLHRCLASVSIFLNKLSGRVKSAHAGSSLGVQSSKKLVSPDKVTSEEQFRKKVVFRQETASRGV